MKLLAALKSAFGKAAAGPQAPHAAADDPTDLLGSVLETEGYKPRHDGPMLLLPSGIRLRAEVGEVVRINEERVRTMTRTIASHERFPQGLLEFQHAPGDTVERALQEGFRAWARMDLVALEDATRDRPRDCTVMDVPGSAAAGRRRQILLGPVAHMVTKPENAPAPDDHPFCPCCLMTSSLQAFLPVLQRDGVAGIRLFASRAQDGTLAADCRVNGEPYEPGVKPLVDYARTWPNRGVEFRKQYVIVRPAM